MQKWRVYMMQKTPHISVTLCNHVLLHQFLTVLAYLHL